MLAVNLDGMFHCCQAALPDLLAAERGRIVTIASMAGPARLRLCLALYRRQARRGRPDPRARRRICRRRTSRVNAVCPGFVDTDMTVAVGRQHQAKTGRSEEEARAELARLNPSGRLIAPEEVAAAVLDLDPLGAQRRGGGDRMNEALAIREKHDGALADRSSVRLWLRLLSCTMAIEKDVQRRFAEHGRHPAPASTCSPRSTAIPRA